MFDDGLELSEPTEHSGILGKNGQSVELRPRGSAAGGKSTRSIRRQTWNREEASLNLNLNKSIQCSNMLRRD